MLQSMLGVRKSAGRGVRLTILATVALLLASGASALPGNGKIVVAHEGAYWLANADGSDPRSLVSGLGLSSPVTWSPDGSRLAFGATGGAYVVDADGTDVHRLVDVDSPVFFPQCWLPTNQIVLAGYTDSPSAVDLWLVRSDGTGLRRLTADGVFKRLSSQPCAADGSKLAYSAGDGAVPTTAYWIALDGGEP